jgi:two-component system sensor histidine kinase DesK
VTTSLTAPRRTLSGPRPVRHAQPPARPSSQRTIGSHTAARLHERWISERSTRLGTTTAVVVAIFFPLHDVWFIYASPQHYGRVVPALVGVAVYLPLHLRHVWFAARATRPPGGTMTMVAMAAIVIGVLPMAGSSWVMEFSWLTVSALIVVRRPWSYVIVIGLVASSLPGALLLGDSTSIDVWYTVAMACRGATLFVLVWLAAAIRQLQTARLALAEEAITRERLRIDGELRRTLGAALESIVARGQRAAAQVGDDRAMLEVELRALIEYSRATLAEARSMVRRYQHVSLRAELDTAAALLFAAGIDTRVSLPGGDFPDTVEEALRAALRAALIRLLRDDTPPRTCLIAVTREHGQTRLELRTDRGGPAPADMVAA